MTDERKALFWLSAGGTPSDKLNKLLEIYGSALEVFEDFSSDKLQKFLGDSVYSKLNSTRDENIICDELMKLKADGIRVLLKTSPDYPEILTHIDAPPAVLYLKGNSALLKTRCISMVGTRRCTDYGKRVATEWAAELSRKFTVVTGHATGIDTYSAKSALDSGGSVISVLASGMDMFSPPDFMRKCPAEKLLLISEYPNGTHTEKFMYRERNRLFGGLSEAVVIVEAAKKSGALITADWACKQNRAVFAVPGSVFSDRSSGVNELIRNGATIATSTDDIFEDLGMERETKEDAPLPEMTENERKVYDFLSGGPRRFDEITDMLSIPSYESSSLLSMMELSGIIEKKMQNYYALLK